MQIFVGNCLSCMRCVFRMLVLAKGSPTCIGAGSEDGLPALEGILRILAGHTHLCFRTP